jgi:hypothetical protein
LSPRRLSPVSPSDHIGETFLLLPDFCDVERLLSGDFVFGDDLSSIILTPIILSVFFSVLGNRCNKSPANKYVSPTQKSPINKSPANRSPNQKSPNQKPHVQPSPTQRFHVIKSPPQRSPPIIPS